MLLNKIPTLDKGYVAFVDSSCNSDKLKQLALEFLQTDKTDSLECAASLTLLIKCPLFVQLNLSKFDLKLIPTISEDVEAYIPNLSDINSRDRETNVLISDDIARTTEALLINPKAYQSDGCDKFTSQVIMPVSTYTTLIAHGSYREWMRFICQVGAPVSISAYINSVKQIVDMEWK